MEKIKVAELFAGVGGFRIGLSIASKKHLILWFLGAFQKDILSQA